MRIGITEAGDAAVDLSWTKRICDCDGAIIITKNLTDEVIAELLRNKKKVILHAFQKQTLPCLVCKVMRFSKQGFREKVVFVCLARLSCFLTRNAVLMVACTATGKIKSVYRRLSITGGFLFFANHTIEKLTVSSNYAEFCQNTVYILENIKNL